MSNKRTSIEKSILSVSGIIIFAKVLGFLKQMFIAKIFGATLSTDVVMLSQGIITDLEYVLSQTMLTAFIPIYISVKADKTKNETRFTGNVFTLVSFLVVLVSIFLFVGAPIVARVIAPSYTSDETLFLIKNIRIYSTIPVVLFWMAFFNALLKANERFIPGEFISVNQSIIYVITIAAFSKRCGVDTLIIAFFIYAFTNFVYLMLCSQKLWNGPKFSFWQDSDIWQLLKMVGPLLLGLATIYINQQVDRMLASGLGAGAVTALSYSAVLTNLVTGFIGSLCGIIFTYVAKYVVDNNDESAAKLVQNIMVIFITILIPIMLVTVFNSNDIVKVVFGRGEFDANAVNKASQALIGYSFVFIPYVVRELLTRLQYSYKESKKPMINSVVSIMINIVLSIIFSKTWGILGITIASSISVVTCAIMNAISSRRYNEYLSVFFLVKPAVLWMGGIFSATIGILILKSLCVNFSPLIRLVIISFGGILIYSIIEIPIIGKYTRLYLIKDK